LSSSETRTASKESDDVGRITADLETLLILPNKRRARVRPLRSHEDDVIRDLYAHLSWRSRYQRFFSPMSELPDSVLRRLTDVDNESRLALVAYADDNPGDIVAMGSFGAIDASSAEVALVVRDDWQRQRLGTALATQVLEAADARGFRRFVTHVLYGNEGIRRILHHVGVVISWRAAAGVTEFVFARRGQSCGASPSS
jgi:GNAT superfamily N-acetyltransferase